MKKLNTKKKRKKSNRKAVASKPEMTITSENTAPTLPPRDEVRQKSKPIVVKTTGEKKREEKKIKYRYVTIAMQFLREARMELKKVKWPTRKELLASTAMVLFLVVALAFFLGLVDFGLIKIIKQIVG